MKTPGRESRVVGWVGVVLLAASALACSATARAPAHVDSAARRLQPPPGYAVVYVLRPEFLGHAVRFDVVVNGTWVGATGGFRYIYTVLRPGHYIFQSRAETVASLRLTVNAGQTYFVEQRPRPGVVMPRNDLVLLPHPVGRARLRQCFLSRAMPPRVMRMAVMAGHVRGATPARVPPSGAPTVATPAAGAPAP